MVITSLSRDYHQLKKYYHQLATLQTVLMAAMVIMREMARWQLESEAFAGAGGTV